MSKFIQHDSLAAGCFNRGYNGAAGTFAAWDRQMQNRPELVRLLVSRMLSDFSNTAVGLRKPFVLKDVAAWLLFFFRNYQA